MNKDIVRSPFFYVGDKYKLMNQLKQLMPENIEVYYEPFVGGGSSVLNTIAKEYVVNDVDNHVIDLHKALSRYAKKPEQLLAQLFSLIDEYGLSCSYLGKTVPDELKKKYVKTYYSRYNKEAYSRLKEDYNKDKTDCIKLYLLLIYGFNHMIRYNASDEFNLPVGNVDFNRNVYNALQSYLEFMKKNKVRFYNTDYQQFIKKQKFQAGDFVFCDPPYLISGSEYNKLWNPEKEKELLNVLDGLNTQGVHFGITNLVMHKGEEKNIFKEWSRQYYVHDIRSNYISFNDNTIKTDSKEVYVTNYARK